MLYVDYTPAPPLSSFVQKFWYMKGYEAPHRRERVLPSGTIQIIIDLAGHAFDSSKTVESASIDPMLIVGVRSQYVVLDTRALRELIGIHFCPGRFAPFSPAPADEFSNLSVSLAALWGSDALELEDRLHAAPTPELKFHVLEEMLLARVCRSRFAPHRAVEFAIRQFQHPAPRVTVEYLTRQIGLSRRRFAEIFRERVGVTPKLYYRIQRFQKAVRQIGRAEEVDWPEVALNCGYFDQSHFINDFHRFSGINPTTYVAKRTRWANHVSIDG